MENVKKELFPSTTATIVALFIFRYDDEEKHCERICLGGENLFGYC